MENEKNLFFKEKADFFKLIGHPLRLKILYELSKTEKNCVNAMQDLLKISQSNLSQHLGILRLGGLVDCKRFGKKKCYCLKNKKMIEKLFQCLDK